jgi:hypothetical protein
MANSGDWTACKNTAKKVVIQTSGCPILLVCAKLKQRPDSILEAARRE